jgi:poly-gamma-glutamate capsule biosynthesis protein CapA/YwtB (metallophosphatase superfamily)
VAVGDVMLARGVHKTVFAGRAAPRRPFAAFDKELAAGDIVFCNLESIIGQGPLPELFPEKPFNFLASTRAAAALVLGHFNVASIANNHGMDFDGDAIAQTRALLAKHKIAVFGAGKNLAEARRPAILKKNGVTVGFLGFSLGHSTAIYAGADAPGVSALVLARVVKNVRALKKKADVVVVSFHWGNEYSTAPSRWQRDMAHRTLDAGADIIIGHHPHVVQGLEVYKGKVIAYSLGNFLFDQKSAETRAGLMLECMISRGGIQGVRARPIVRGAHFFPEPPSVEDNKAIVAHLRTLSDSLNSKNPGWQKTVAFFNEER